MSLNFLNEGNKQFNEAERDLNQHSITSCYRKDHIQFWRHNYMYGRSGSKSQESKRKIFQPTDKVTSHSYFGISIPQSYVTNLVLSHFTCHQPMCRLKLNWYLSLCFLVIIHNGDVSTQICYWHLLKTQESDNNSGSAVSTYGVGVWFCVTV